MGTRHGPSQLHGKRAMNFSSVFRFLLTITLLVVAPSAFPETQSGGVARIALVIGNADYPDSSTPLATTERDARTLTAEFRRLNFAVDSRENASKDDMRRAIDEFVGKIRRGTVALFYFSGYGLQAGRQTYLIP